MTKIQIVILALLLATVYSQCPTGCSACSSPTQCTSCSPRFFLVNGTQCAPCPTGCSACNQGSDGRPACTACTAPAQLDSTAGRCFLCDPSCLTCGSSPTTCTSCRDGKELTSNSTCAAPAGCNIRNCGNCTTDLAGNLVCERCIQGYFPFKQGCVPCKFPCAVCNFNRDLVWLAVSAFWDPLIRTALNITVPTPPPGLLPPFTNNLDFAGMNETLKQGWTEAFFVVSMAINAYADPNLFAASIPEHIAFYMVNQNKTSQEFYGLLVQRFSNITNKTWTLEEFNNKLGLAASELTICATCGTGFVLVGNNCTRCPAGCEQCASGSCTVCRNGTFLSSGTCVPCASSCLTCSTAGNSCTSCASPASLVGNACIMCQQPCATCSPTNTSSCVSCKKPFSQLANAGTCFRCDQDLCDTCDSTNSSICLLCRPGATLIEGRCQLCPANCSNCFVGTNSSICFQCLTGYELNTINNQTRCLPCRPGCRSCANRICLQCQAGTYLEPSNGTCLRCKQGCTACSSLQTCTVYEKGMIIIGDKVVACRPGCKTCDTPQVCTECEARYFLSSGICRQCEPGCSTCTDETVCTKCIDNLILASGNCTACAGNCRTCNSANVTQCLTCKRGFTLVGTQCVYQCRLGCLECDAANSSICITCAQGHSLRPDGRCIKCLGSCSGSCDPRNISICLSCVDGFELKQNQCVRCPLGCATCLVGQCSSCLTGYTLTQSRSGSFVCQEKCKPPCATCSGGVCSACETGFTFSNGRCSPDLSCNPYCSFCPVGTQRFGGGPCIACPTNCASCSSGVCLQCLKGFYLNSTSCAACPSKCKTCYNADNCDECAPGFVKEIVSMTSSIADAVFSDNCTACSSNCRTCIVEPDRCTSCPEGSRLKGSRCAGMFTVVYEYEVNIAYATFLDNSESDAFIEILSNMANVNKSDNFIDYVREGSTVIGGTISTSSQTQASSVQSGLGSSVGGYSILSSSASVYYGDTAYTQQKTEEIKTSANVGLIVGVVVGAVVAISVISFLIYKFKCKKSQVSQKQQTSEQAFNQKQ